MPSNVKSSIFRQEFGDSEHNTGEKLNIRQDSADGEDKLHGSWEIIITVVNKV